MSKKEINKRDMSVDKTPDVQIKINASHITKGALSRRHLLKAFKNNIIKN